MRQRLTPAHPALRAAGPQAPNPVLVPALCSQILDTMPSGLVLLDTEGAPIFTNRCARDLLGAGIAGARTVGALGSTYPLRVAGTATPYPVSRLPFWRALRGERTTVTDLEVLHPKGPTSLTMEAVPVTTDRQGVVLAVAVLLEPSGERAVAALRAQLAAIVESSEDAIIQFSLEGTIEAWNPAAERLYGYNALEAIGKSMEMLIPHERKDELTFVLRRAGGGERLLQLETTRLRKDGSLVHVCVNARPVWSASGSVVGVAATSRDMSDLMRAKHRQRELEEQLHHARRMEEVGRLAGGVAHDFNTLLTVISAHAQFLRDAPPGNDESRNDVEEILHAVERGARLTASLLGYTRKQVATPTPVEINEVVSDTVEMLRRVIGQNITMSVSLDPSLGSVLIERGELEQVIMNLTLNARDAMATRGGELTIRTVRTWVEEDAEGPPRSGAYAELTVSDTGVGMSPDTARRVFDPYFTTKEQHGTGLGLSTVNRIVAQSNGHVALHSEPGAGTRISLFLPLLGVHRVESAKAEQPEDELPHGSETVLIVDDDPSLCATTSRILETDGYTVITAGFGHDAEEIVRHHEGEIHVVVADVTSDHRVRDFLAELSESRPSARMVFMSGYLDEAGRAAMVGPGVSFIAKPYMPEQLVRTVRDLLEAPLVTAD
ncbi:MAG TPA: PAS domain S-box protein [Gemmatimonadaceae bacterium]|nr:PAS domain S-box protein [Gemmatimonadaceae bacterium]